MSFKDCIIIIASVFLSANSVSDKMNMNQPYPASRQPSQGILLFLCGDVMTGRGIDQILPYSVDPQIYEP